MTSKEGSFSRWSRLKAKGSVSQFHDRRLKGQEVQIEDPELIYQDQKGIDEEIAVVEAKAGGAENVKRKSNSFPVMPPLAGVEEGDTEFESPPPEALAMLSREENLNSSSRKGEKESEGDDRNLTEEEKEVVAALPPLESLKKDSDFTPFMMEKVPGFIRRKALRVLWRSDPVLANLDGLNDYDEDFNIIDTLIDAAKDSAYKVGKGMVSEEEEKSQVEAEKVLDQSEVNEGKLEVSEKQGELIVESKTTDEVKEGSLSDENGPEDHI